MPTRAYTRRSAVLGVAVLALLLGGFALSARGHRVAPPVRRHAAAAPHPPSITPVRTPLPPARKHASPYLAIAQADYARSRAWWDPRRQWYRQFLPGDGTGAATMWGIVHLFGAASALAIADPTPANVTNARWFGTQAEGYWDPNLRPVPGYGPSRSNHGTHAWYDDEAWWGVAFFDAYRATGDRRFLSDASRALAFIDSGWDPRQGGIYWDTKRTFKASESLAGGTLTAAGLYQATHDPHYLALADKYIGWADAHLRGPDGLYGAHSTPATPMPYVEGPMAEALLRLCKATGRASYCRAGEHLMRASADRFRTLQMGPQFDALYLRAVLEVYRMDHNPRWYRIAADAAQGARANAADAGGLELRTWAGLPISSIGTPLGKLQTHAATTSLFAWLAAAEPPGRRHQR